MRKTIALGLLLSLAACSSLIPGKGPAEVSPPPPGVSYRVENNDIAATEKKAQDYCGRYGKKAKRQDTNTAGDSTIVQYSCS